MKNSATRVLVSYLSANPHLVDSRCSNKDLISNMIIDHTNHLLVLALAAASLEHIDWQEIENTIEAIKSKD